MFSKKTNLINKYFKLFDNYPRHYFVFGFFVFWFIVTLSSVFSYTIKDHDFYKKLADKQQIGEIKVPVNRWAIYSSTWSWTIYATSVNLNDLAIDPTMAWDKAKLSIFLRDIVFTEACVGKLEQECKDNVLKFLKKIDIEDFQFEEKFIKDLILSDLTKKLSQKKVTSVLLTDFWDKTKLSQISQMQIPWIYVTDIAVYANPEEITDPKDVAKKVSQLIWFNEEDTEYILRKRELKYLHIWSKLSIDSSSYVQNYIKEESDAIYKWVLDNSKAISKFIILTPNAHRYYPEWKIASQVLGFVDNNSVWHYWIEGFFNDILKWQDGQMVSRKDIMWRTIDPINLWNNSELDWEWAMIYSTIDRNVQRNVEKILEEWVKSSRSNKWSVVVMDPNTGRIIAMATYPNYDPNNPWDVYELKKVNYREYPNPANDLLWKAVFVEDSIKWKEFIFDNKKILLRLAEREELGVYALTKYIFKNEFWPEVYNSSSITDIYEPGSIMKTVTVAAWIDSWEIDSYEFYQDRWELKVWDFTIKNVSSACLWTHTFAHALNFSCNIWMWRIADRMWKALFYNYLVDFWFGSKTDISLQWEISVPLDSYEKWPRSKLYTSSYWLWIWVTQLQMTSAYATLVNWGLVLRPYIIDRIEFSDWKVIKYQKEIIRRAIKESTSETIRKLLVDSIENWVAKTWKVEWYLIWWKTWTSQIAYRWGYENGIWWTNWSFAWFWPAEDPKFVVNVWFSRPRTSVYGWETSAYTFANISKYLLEYYEIPKKWVK